MLNEKLFIEINSRRIGQGYPTYIIAELSANHQQNFEDAVALIRKAKEVGADAVKLQTYTPDTITINVDSELFRHGEGSLWAGRTLYDLYSEAYMPWEWQPKLKAIADELGMDLFSTAFDPSAVDFLEEMGVPAHKVASFEIVDIPLIEKMARTGKPLIISTGMATLGEIEDAVQAARGAGVTQIALLKCTSAYPAPSEEMNLRTIPHLAEAFHVAVGLSDHTLGIAVPVAAVALGACIIEKHFTLSRSNPGPDSAFSLEPQEFKAMVEAVRSVEKALGEIHYGVSEREAKSRGFRRSLFAVKNMKAGERFTDKNVRSIRPGHGLLPKYLQEVLGRRAAKDIEPGTPLKWEMISEEEYKTLMLKSARANDEPAASNADFLKKVIFQQMLQLSSANVFVQVARFIKNLAFARMLGPNLFGLWNGLQTILIYGTNAHLGVLQAMTREIPLNRGRGALQLIPSIVRISLSFTLVSTSLIAAILFAVGAMLDPSKIEATALKLIAAVLVAQQLFQFFHFLLRAENDFGRLSLVLIVQTILELVVSVGLIYWIGFNGIFYGFIISFTIVTLICLKWKYPLIRGLELDFKLAGNLIRIGFPIMLVGLSYNLLTTLDRVMIIKFLGSEQLGYYALGPLMLMAIAYVPTTINQVMYPKFGERYGTTGDPRSLVGFVRVSTLITAHLMGLVLGVAFLVIPLVALLVGNYAPGIPAARILLAGFYFISLVGPAANLLITIDRQMQYLYWMVAVAILVVALDGVAIIANFGIEGIAAATGISYAVYAFGMISFTLLRHLAFSNRELGKTLAKVTLPYLAAIGAIWSVSQLHASSQFVLIGLQLVLFVTIYGLISYFLLRREFSP